MHLDNSNYRIIKPAPSAPRTTTLDYSSISGTTTYGGKSRLTRAQRIKYRFPDDIWYDRKFRAWALKYDSMRFRQLGLDYEGNIRINNGKYMLRWSDERKRKNLATIYSWCERVLDVKAYYMVTLTVKHGTFGSYKDMADTVDMLRECWNGVRRFVNRRGWTYLRVMEPGEINHYPHYHMVICDVDNPEDVRKLVYLWLDTAHKLGNNASPKAQEVSYTKDVRKVGAYVAKYLSKTVEFDVTDMYFWRWMELSYRKGIRVFAMDKESSKYIKWKYLKLPKGTHGDTETYEEGNV